MVQTISTGTFKRGFGYIPDLGDKHDFTLPLMARHAPELPDHIDLRSRMPAVYDQGELGSCTANAIAAAIQYDRMKQNCANASEQVPSRLFIYYNERKMEGTVKSDAGAQIRDGIKSVAKLGACFEDLWPYNPHNFAVAPPQDCYNVAQLDRAVKYQRVIQTELHMRDCLANVGPFAIGFTCYESFESDKVATTGLLGLPGSREKVVGGHAVLVVGYDQATKRFLVRNSWGASWGMKGYFSVPYDYFTDNDLADDLWNIQLVSQ